VSRRRPRGLNTAVSVGLLLSQSMPLLAGATDPMLGCADSFAILSAAGVANKGRSKIYGNVGVEPAGTIGGFPPGAVFNGLIYLGGPVAHEARRDALDAYNRLKQLPSLPIASAGEGNLGGVKLYPGVYALDYSAHLNGTIKLDAQGMDYAVFVFQIGTNLTTAPGAAVVLLHPGFGDAVYWQVGGSANLAKNTSFEGNILAYKDIAMETRAGVRCGRAFALTGAIVMDRNYISPACASTPAPIPGFVGSFIAPPLTPAGGSPSLIPVNVISSPEPGTFWLAGICLAAGITIRYRARTAKTHR
jgi:hypothetical protein